MRALTPHGEQPATQELKLVTFVPSEHVAKVRDGLASAGAGIIGAYTRCSFAGEGLGTFLGGAGSSPAVGAQGAFEQARETRLEMVVSKTALALALETLRRFHPYESPAIDVYQLLAQPTRGLGAGRRLVLDKPESVRTLAARLKKFLGCQRVEVGAANLDALVERVGVVPGAGGSLAALARTEGCEVFVTGEMKHHDVLAARAAGLSVILAGHTATERGYFPRYQERLRTLAPQMPVMVSTADIDPLVLIAT